MIGYLSPKSRAIIDSLLNTPIIPNNMNTRIAAILDKLRFSGDIYTGDYSLGNRHGKGVLRDAEGDVYEGDFVNGKRHGKGMLRRDAEGDVYEGDFVNGKRHGKGVLRDAEGDVYEGNFFQGHAREDGKLTHNFGVCHGLGCLRPTTIKDASHIQEEHFLRLLTQKKSDGATGGYSLAIIADFLIKNGFETVGTQLEEAHRICVLKYMGNPNAIKKHYRAIYQAIQTPNTPKLLLTGPIWHGIGLRLVQTVPGYIDCEIFNSGNGLKEHHVQHPEKKEVFQTMLRVRVPATSLTQNKLQELLLKKHFEIKDFYAKILTLKGAVVIEPDPNTAIWQREQQSDNCSLMWIFAFLETNMSHQEYNRMLYTLFRDCADAAQKAGVPEEIQRDLVKQRDLLAPKSKL